MEDREFESTFLHRPVMSPWRWMPIGWKAVPPMGPYVVVYSVLQFLEGNVLTPFIVGGKVRLFPLTVMVAFISWGLLWGVPGAVLAVPLTSAIKVVCEHIKGWEGFARLLGDPDPPPAR